MKHCHRNPILVTGAHRSGTTIVGRLLALPPNIGFIPEPFNRDCGLRGIDRWFPYVHAGMPGEDRYRHLVETLLSGKARFRVLSQDGRGAARARSRARRVLTRKPRRVLGDSAFLAYHRARWNPRVNRYLLKDPLACLASEWLHQQFEMDVVLLVRHPAAFVASLRRMGWGFDFNELLAQDELMSDHLGERREEMLEPHASLIEVGATLWNCIYAVLTDYADRNPRMIVVRHEDISNDPEGQFSSLYRKLGMELDDQIVREIGRFTGADNPVDPRRGVQHDLARNSKANVTRWKSILSEDERAIVRERTHELATRYYGENDW